MTESKTAMTILVGTITIVVVGLVGSAMPQRAPSAPPAPPSTAINWRYGAMLSAWQKVEKPERPGWALRVTPPLPLHWGENRPIEWVLYGYPADVLPQAADAERIARPFAIGRIGRPPSPNEDPEAKVDMLRTAIEPLELQGVKPRYVSANPIVWQPIERACLSLTAPPAPDSSVAALVRNAYRGWLDDNGIIAKELSKDHEAFFAWARAK